ncbi:MAG: nucleotide sugar dehydrogenase [Magnetovibrio sp.]|nr:nucleotide sugar dehydrogenase [Magnetovibrio sp.]
MTLPTDYPDRAVCVVGLGYVGLTLAVTMADVGFQVHGVEIREEVLDKLQRGEPHFFEPGLTDMLARAAEHGRLTYARHITGEPVTRVYVITVGTPLDGDGRSRMDMVANVSREIAGVLNDGDLVIMRSTVKIGTTRDVVMPILDSAGVDYDIAFCPERTLEGQALPELRHLPQIVGAQNEQANARTAQLFQYLTPTVVRVGSIETAETIKLVDNAQRDVRFGFANEVARVCDAVGVSAEEVIRAGKLGYPRTNIPMPGPVGGPCLEKDPYILAESVEDKIGTLAITLGARRLNEAQPADAIGHLKAASAAIDGFPDDPVVTLAGIAFKGRPATDDMRGTTARLILDALMDAYPDARFRGFDALVDDATLSAFGLQPADDLEAAFAGANLFVIANNHPAFESMPVTRLAASMARPALIYDFWNNFIATDLDLPAGVGYLALGSHGVGRLPAG